MKEDRISELENYILEKERASIEELCSVFNVSKNTMRRDINQLELKGKIKKVYGGIILTDKKTTEPFESREVKNKSAKLIIADLASTLIEDGDIVYIDSGTTTMHMIPYLSERKNVTIITNNLHVILNSLPYQNLNIISTGGTLFRRTNSFVDAEAVNSLKKYNISKAFLATTGVSIAKGITNSSSLEYDIKRYIVEHCDKKILLADNTKLEKVSLITYYDLKDIQVFISEQRPEQEYVDFFASNNISLLTPQ
ncbi:DeoR/GlpR family DNA-binding transcription regulator [Pelosinus sp. UFO1]|uniref:DeoR/GlpR family DNA-binding transcription regulator n=1 Tax=Pelosinus sp. UFO1 TaxID=484770 RepID=UPI0004D0C091|nr:DeoR/GlpR family DNA-binding transcription regulator [Pelosinus sp. UFO1]AIF52719.1 transcriptional regulator, DeoR family [Pelosinus sp. UFO1]